ncbi:MAG: hypothetical protein JOZ99_07850, partial [Actinobacteria bacterium]|nr:hypothetical protein [Actinomycetota bacterium]
ELWIRYFGLGGTSTPSDVHGYLDGGPIRPGQHDVLAHALNERFVEMGMDHPVPYDSD